MQLSNEARYAQCMERIKWRIDVAQNLINHQTTTGAEMNELEFLALQLRKILEGIALASICAHRSEYEKIKTEIWKDWNARLIIRDIERINPNFYPQPQKGEDGIDESMPKVRILAPKTSGFLTKKEYLKLYVKTASLLHEDNPFTEMNENDIQSKFNDLASTVPLIVGLLNKHIIDSGKDEVWIVLMRAVSDNKVHVANFQVM